jgi:hypothetical protein
MAEIEDELPQRDDRSQSGRYFFNNNNVGYCDDGIDGLIHFVPFDKGPWVKNDNGDATSLFAMSVDEGGSYRVSEHITPTLLDTGVATIDLWRRFQLPIDFGSFPADALSIFIKNFSVADTGSCALRIYNAATSAAIISSAIPAVDDTWEEFTANMPAGLEPYLAGQWFTLKFSVSVTDLANIIDIADLSLRYKSARGNV